MGQIGMTISVTMAILFSIAILGFAIGFAYDNHSKVDIADDSIMDSLYTDTYSHLEENISKDSNDTYTSIVSSTVESGSSTFRSAGALEITASNLLPTFYNILRVGYAKIFGTDSGFLIFISTFIALLGFIMILFIIKTFIGGNPD